MIQPPLPDGPPVAAPDDPWADYLAAAGRLDAVRRAASSVVTEQAQTVQAAQQELAGVRARLAPQRARLVRDLGVPEADLMPQLPELAAATQAVTGGPAARPRRAAAGPRHGGRRRRVDAGAGTLGTVDRRGCATCSSTARSQWRYSWSR